MKYSIDKQEKYSVIKVDEEKLDSTKAPDFKSRFVTLQAEGVKNLVVDLSPVKYIDSSGLSALLVGNRLFTEAKGAFVISCVNDHVMKLITISQLDKVLEILPSVEEGVDRAMMNALENDLNAGESGK
ncbi:MAG: STAS domain-containing protein [Cyclobacteriaceae bacterium]